jgi:hypothetical protein
LQQVTKALEKIGVETKHFGALTALCFPAEDMGSEAGTGGEDRKIKRYGPKKDDGPKSITVDDFVKIVVRLRPEKSASIMDVAEIFVGLRTEFTNTRDVHEQELERVNQHELKFEASVTDLLKRMKKLETRIEKWEEQHISAVKDKTAGLPPELLAFSQRFIKGR